MPHCTKTYMKATFCINTSRNEKDHLELLLTSLLNGVDVKLHDFLVFVDSDNQNTTDLLLANKVDFPNLTIIKNNGDPIGYAGNINYMFQKAKTDIVSYLQSDQVVCLNYDKKILSHLSDNMVLSATRVEPPLHSKSDNTVTDRTLCRTFNPIKWCVLTMTKKSCHICQIIWYYQLHG